MLRCLASIVYIILLSSSLQAMNIKSLMHEKNEHPIQDISVFKLPEKKEPTAKSSKTKLHDHSYTCHWKNCCATYKDEHALWQHRKDEHLPLFAVLLQHNGVQMSKYTYMGAGNYFLGLCMCGHYGIVAQHLDALELSLTKHSQLSGCGSLL